MRLFRHTRAHARRTSADLKSPACLSGWETAPSCCLPPSNDAFPLGGSDGNQLMQRELWRSTQEKKKKRKKCLTPSTDSLAFLCGAVARCTELVINRGAFISKSQPSDPTEWAQLKGSNEHRHYFNRLQHRRPIDWSMPDADMEKMKENLTRGILLVFFFSF